MTERPFHVAVIGGGIGGLCLAQGLRRKGVSVAVYERDRETPDRDQGYRLHIDPSGSRALRACLPASAWGAFLASAGDPDGGFSFLSEKLERLVTVDGVTMYGVPSGPDEWHYPVDRLMLRRILLSGLEDVVHFGREFTRYEHWIRRSGHRSLRRRRSSQRRCPRRRRRRQLARPPPAAPSRAPTAHRRPRGRAQAAADRRNPGLVAATTRDRDEPGLGTGALLLVHCGVSATPGGRDGATRCARHAGGRSRGLPRLPPMRVRRIGRLIPR